MWQTRNKKKISQDQEGLPLDWASKSRFTSAVTLDWLHRWQTWCFFIWASNSISGLSCLSNVISLSLLVHIRYWQIHRAKVWSIAWGSTILRNQSHLASVIDSNKEHFNTIFWHLHRVMRQCEDTGQSAVGTVDSWWSMVESRPRIVVRLRMATSTTQTPTKLGKNYIRRLAKLGQNTAGIRKWSHHACV